MNGAKTWQIVLIVVAVLAASASLWYQIFGGDDLSSSDSITLVDVKTGELFKSPKPSKRAIELPAINPNTKTNTLVPAYQENNEWFVSDLFVGYARSNAATGSASIFAEPKGGKINPKSPEPVVVDLFKNP
ncbi:MAG: hypothetical protein NTV94_09500 [Planctomycetota bacterium]|nr:hypothetical protein [Planctomycetota bacterium]